MSFKHLLSTTTTTAAAAVNAVGGGVAMAEGFISKHRKQQELRNKSDIAAFKIELRSETLLRVDTALNQLNNIDVDRAEAALAAALAE